jgi:hypothetical protein
VTSILEVLTVVQTVLIIVLLLRLRSLLTMVNTIGHTQHIALFHPEEIQSNPCETAQDPEEMATKLVDAFHEFYRESGADAVKEWDEGE